MSTQMDRRIDRQTDDTAIFFALVDALAKKKAEPAQFLEMTAYFGALVLNFTNTSPGEILDKILEYASDSKTMRLTTRHLKAAGFPVVED